MKKLKISVVIEQKAARLDKVLAGTLHKTSSGFPALSRSTIQKLIKTGCVSCAGKGIIKDPNHKTITGEIYTILLPDPEPAVPKPQFIPLAIVYEDSDIIVINKPPGMVVHPAAGNSEGTLVNALLAHCGNSLSGIGGVARPGIVHRLDKDTSGLLVVAKNDAAHQALSRQFGDRTLSRVYKILIWGTPKIISGKIEGNIGRHPRERQKMAILLHGGKQAVTTYNVIKSYGTVTSFVECKLETGRTHQIRVHMSHIKHPIVGDRLYGRRHKIKRTKEDGIKTKSIIGMLDAFPRQALHAAEIKFIHPRTGKKMKFKAPMPEDMKSLLAILEKSGL